MDKSLTFILFLGLGIFLSFQLCSDDRKSKPEVEPRRQATRAHDPANKVFATGAAAKAKAAQPSLETDRLKVIFDTRGAAVRQVFLKNHVRRPGESVEDPANWVPVIDHRIFEARVDGEDEGVYRFSFQFLDTRQKLNLFAGTPEKPVPSGPGYHAWGHETFRDGPVVGIRFTLGLSSGLELVKEYRLQEEEYRFDLRLTLRNRSCKLPEGTTRWQFALQGAAAVPTQDFMLGPRYKVNDFYGNSRAILGLLPDTGSELETVVVNAEKTGGKKVLGTGMPRNGRFRFAGSYHKFYACLITATDDRTADSVVNVATTFHPDPLPRPTWPEGIATGLRSSDRTGAYSHAVPELGLKVKVPLPGEEVALDFMVYTGPKDVTLWTGRPEYKDFYSVYKADLNSGACCAAIPGVSQIGNLLLKIMRFFHGLVGNWGVAIIMLTLVVRLMLSPFNYKSQFEMAKYSKRMAKVKPLMDEIKKKYGKNKQKMQQEMMKLQREHKLTPPLMGCLPMFITMPVFIGLFMALRISFDLRHQPFFGWIRDLSMPDRLIHLHDSTEGIVGWTTHFNLLPILMALLMWLQQRSMPKSDDPQQKQMQIMMQFMPIMMLIFLYNYAAGLALYMCVSSTFAIFESRIIRRRVKAATGAEGGAMGPVM